VQQEGPTGTEATSKNTYIPKTDYQDDVKPTDLSDTTNSSNNNTHTEQTSEPTNEMSKLSISDHAPNNQTDNPINASQGGAPTSLQDTDKTGVTSGNIGDARKASDIPLSSRSENPGATPASGSSTEYKQQTAGNPLEAPKDEQVGAIKDTTENAEELLKKRDPNDHSGEPMHMHDGSEKLPTTQEERRDSKLGNPGGQEHGKEPKGTGEQWVKTSGLAADGGTLTLRSLVLARKQIVRG
jgi:hypothetical protein